MYKDTLISTVGTSLLGNLQRSGDPSLQKTVADRNAIALAKQLAVYNPDDKILGAEINSIESIIKKGYLQDKQNVHFLFSDTDDGRFLSSILKVYYSQTSNPHAFEQVKCSCLEGLSDEDPQQFRQIGLRNLVREIASLVNIYGNNRLVINATGGYKAQISFAGMIGQALEIPVCYMFEKFYEVIELPPQPIALDFSFWLEHVDLFFALSQDSETNEDPRPQDDRFESLVESISCDTVQIIGLSPVGQLFHESFRYRFRKQSQTLLPKDANMAPEEKAIKYEDGNAGKHQGLSAYIDKLLKFPYIIRAYTHYYNPDLPQKNTFKISTKGGVSQIEAVYSDGKATTKFDLVTTAENSGQRDAVLADLNDRMNA